jgi:hypothetical protein
MNNRGMAIVTVLMLISVLLILIISLSTNSITNFSISKNSKDNSIDFYRSESGNKIEISDIITISVSNITNPSEPPIKDTNVDFSDGTSSFAYHSTIKFEFYKPTIKPGTSMNMFSNYYYTVRTGINNTEIKTLVYKLGPKM